MDTRTRLKLAALIFFIICAAALFTENVANRRAHAYSAGPPAGYTRAPGEEPEACAECHLVTEAGTGRIEIDAPASYVPGETYQITVRHVNQDMTRRRWGFEMTALDESDQRAGTFVPLDNTTQVLNNQGPYPTRQYVEHTSNGTFFGQTGGASWTFRWTAPSEDVGVVRFYAAGNHANGDQNSSGDHIYFTFVAAAPAQPTPDFALTVAPPSRIVAPGGSAAYDVTVTPSNNFTGAVTLNASGLPPGAGAGFNPPAVSVTNASAQTSALTVTTDASTPLGSYQLNVSATSGALQRSAPATLVVASPSSADLSITSTDSPDPVPVRTNLSYRITVTNNGPAQATGVTVTDQRPAGTDFVSVTSSQGVCSFVSGTITCTPDVLAVGASAVITVVVAPQNVGQLTNTVTVSGAQADPVPSNNSATTTTAVELQGSTPLMLVPNLGVRNVVTGLEQPTGIAFLGASDFLVTEKATGKVKRVTNGAVAATVLDLPVSSGSEQGLLGIALHPNFAANNFVYLYWTENGPGVDSTDLSVVLLLGNRVDRYVWNGNALVFDRNVIRLRAYQEDEGQPLRGNHNGGRLAFGPDGKLYVMIGDVGRRGLMQNLSTGFGPAGKDDQFGGPEPDDGHLTGVVLRLNDDGTTPTDNPFFNAQTGLTAPTAAENVRKVFAYGVRNGFGMAFDPLSGHLWTQENGDDAFDEINRVEAGSNNGWIQFMGPSSRVAEYKSIEVSRAGGLQQNRWPPTLIADTPAEALARLYQLPGSAYNDPQFSWKYAVAPSPLGFARGTGLGPQYSGDMFVGASRTTLLGGYLFRFKMSADRRRVETADSRLADGVADNLDKFDLTESESLVAGRDFGITTDIQTGPDGNLYVVSLSNGAVYQVFARKEVFTAHLDGAQVVPASSSTARGRATISLDTDGVSAAVTVDFCCLGNAVAAIHLHGPAAPGANAPAVHNLPSSRPIINFPVTLTPAQAADLRAGRFYIDIHTADFPDGAIRGQFGGPAAVGASTAQFGVFPPRVTEGTVVATVEVSRAGDLSAAGTVDYATSDGTASERTDYTTARGTLRFAPGEATKSFEVIIADDSFVEGSETINLTLSNPTGGITALGPVSTDAVTITDNDTAPASANPIDDTAFFVRQHYADFFSRLPDPAGLAFWINHIESCGADARCREDRRIDTSAAFFLSIEFQQTGYFVYRLYGASFDRQPRFNEFIRGTQEIGRGVIVGEGDWQARIESNRVAFLNEWVARADFRAAYDPLTDAQYVDRLFANAGVTPAQAERDALVAGLASGAETRQTVLRKVAENGVFRALEYNRAFVLMQYFGYLRRNPDDPPEATLDFQGYNFWLRKLDEHSGDFRAAEMVKSFLVSGEYRGRFGRP